MSDTNKNSNVATVTNPLQTNNTAIMIVGYAAGVLATKFPIFDSMTWNTIVLSVLGGVVTIYTAIINRKSAVVSTVANMAEVKNIDLDKSVIGTGVLAQATPDNVVVK